MAKMYPKRTVRITIDADLTVGDYDITYTNTSHPGQPMDFTEILRFVSKVFAQNAVQIEDDAAQQATGQAHYDPDEGGFN